MFSLFTDFWIVLGIVVGIIFGGKMILAFLTGSIIAFWIIIALSIILMSYWLDDDDSHGVLTTLCFGLTVWLLGFVNKGPFYDFVHNIHLSKLLFIAIGYIVVGILWSFIKWYSFLLRRRDELIEKQEKSKQMHGLSGSIRTSSVPAKSAVINKDDIPSAKDNKAKIILWMSYWPWSVIWTILNDPIRRLFNFIYRKISKIYQKIADRVFRDLVSKE